MGGRQQHYLPQFLQKNFHSKKVGSEYYVFAHRKGSSFQPNTSSIGQQRDFYGHPEKSVADDNITRAENKLSEIVQQILVGNPELVSQGDCALLFASLSLRTKKMRESLKDLAPELMRALREAAISVDLAANEFDRFLSDKKNISSLVEEQLSKIPGLSRDRRAALSLAAKSHLVSQAASHRDELIESVRQKFDQIVSRLVEEASSVADSSFLKIFESSSVPDARVSFFRGFEYSVVKAQGDEKFILGDCAVVAIQSDGKSKLALGRVNDEVILGEIWLPLSPSLAVVGRRDGFRSGLSVSQINMASATLSHEFFISDSSDLESVDDLKNVIGSAESLLTTEELREISSFEDDLSRNHSRRG